MTDALFPDLSDLDSLLATLPGPPPRTLEYFLALLMVAHGQAQLLGVVPATPSEGKGPAGSIAVFKALDGEVFTVFNPTLSETEEKRWKEMIWDTLEREGWE